MPTVEWNRRVWDAEYPWTQDGDEWNDQAAFCGQPYESWKAALIETFLRPNVTEQSTVLEIGPGHGRWTEHYAPIARDVRLVDLSPACLEFCARRFADRKNIQYHATDGKRLPGAQDGSVDFVWSYDAFVHMERDVIDSYLAEVARVLRPGGRAVIHHPGRRHLARLARPILRKFDPAGRRLYARLSMGRPDGYDGERSDVSREWVAQAARRHGLEVVSQMDAWGPRGEFTVRAYRDCITTLRKPAA